MDNQMTDMKPSVSSGNFVQSSQPVFINQNGEDIHHLEAVE
jgi:hypothetical protein